MRNTRKFLFVPDLDEETWADCLYCVVTQCSHKVPPQYLAHFLLCSWIMGGRHRLFALHIVASILKHNIDHDWSKSLLTEALVETNLVKMFSEAIRYELESPDVLGAELNDVMVVLHFSCYYCPSVRRQESMIPSSGQASTAENIAFACHRQFCAASIHDCPRILIQGVVTIPSVALCPYIC